LITKNLENYEKYELIFLKIIPKSRIIVYGVGHSIWKLRGSHAEGEYSVRIPEERL